MRKKAVFLLALVSVGAFACNKPLGLSAKDVGQILDTVCIEGRLSQAQCDAVNELEWEYCPKYRRRYQDGCTCEHRDRVFSKDCADALKRLSTGDIH